MIVTSPVPASKRAAPHPLCRDCGHRCGRMAMVLAQRPGVKLRAVPFLAVVDPARPTRTVARNLDDLESDANGEHLAPRLREFLGAARTSILDGTPAPSEPGWLKTKWTRLWSRLWGH